MNFVISVPFYGRSFLLSTLTALDWRWTLRQTLDQQSATAARAVPVAFHICIGSVYAWSTFNRPIQSLFPNEPWAPQSYVPSESCSSSWLPCAHFSTGQFRPTFIIWITRIGLTEVRDDCLKTKRKTTP